MANNNIEIKLSLNNPQTLTKFLDKKTTQGTKNIYQKDTYYTPAHKDFLAPKYPFEWLRTRESSKGMFITYKYFHPANAAIHDYCDELETKVEDVKITQDIFKALDFKQIIIVEKYRSTWKYKDVEIVIDTVTDLGTFIELESIKEFTDPKDGKPYLHEILTELKADTSNEIEKGYPFLLLEKQGHTSAK